MAQSAVGYFLHCIIFIIFAISKKGKSAIKNQIHEIQYRRQIAPATTFGS